MFHACGSGGVQLSVAEPYYFALEQVVVIADACRVGDTDFIVVLFRDDVDDTRDSIASIQGRGGSFYNLDAFDGCRVDDTQVVLSADVAVHPFPVHHDQDIVVLQSV